MRRRDRLRVTVVAGAALLIGALLLSCSRDTSAPTGPHDPPPAAVATVTVLGAPTDGLLLVGQPTSLSVDVRDAAGVALQGRSVVWSTSNAMVATASSLGVVTATATGVVTITAVVEGHSGAADFTARFAIGTPSAGASQAMTTSILSGSVLVTVPPNAIAAGSVLNVAPANAAGLPAGNQLMPNTAFAFGPDGTQFATPISLSLQVDTSSLASWERAGLAIYLLKNGAWEEVPGSTMSGDHVKASLSHFSTYGVLRRLPPTTMSIVAGNGQTAIVSTAVAVRPSVKLLDASGRGVQFVPVQFAVTGGGGSVTGGSQLTDASGTATVGGWTLGPNVGSNSLTATSVGLPNLTVVATATAPSPVGMSIYGGDAQSAPIGTLLPIRSAVTVTDARGNGVAGVEVQFGVTGGGGTLAGASQVTDADGIARVGGWTLGPVAGPNSIAATSAGLPPVTFTATATGPAGPPPVVMLIVSQPDLVQNGVTFPSPIVVDLVDSLQARVQGSSLPVTLSMFSGNGTLAGTLTVTAVAGRATFADVRMTGPSGDNWILISAPGIYPSAVRVTITPVGQSKSLRLRAPLQGVAASAPYPDQPVVEIVDALGRRVAGATNNVFVADFGDPSSLLGTRSVRAVDGVATFADLATDWAGIHRLYFTSDDQDIAPALSDFFHVASNVSMVTRPSTPTRSGALLSPQPAVMLSDFSTYAPLLTPSPGNTAYVTASVGPDQYIPGWPGTQHGTLSGTTTVRAVNGIATFTDLKVSGLGPVRIIFSVSPRLFDAFTDLFVSPAVAQVPAQIAILAQPTTATSGVNADYFMFELRDASGAPIFGDVYPVTVAVASGNGTLTGTTTETSYQYGYGYFRNFAIAGSGLHTLVFSTGGASVRSAPITVTQIPKSLVITTQPAGSVSGVVLPTQPVVKILDDAGLPVMASTPVTVSVVNSGPVTLSGPTTVNAVNGVATFSGLKVAGGRDFALQFTVPSGPYAQSQTLRLSQVAARLRVVTQPSQAISGYSLNPPTVEVLDADGERVAYTSNTVTATLNSGPGISMIGGTSVAPVFGLASFLMFLKGAGAFSFDFAYPGVAGVSSNSIVLAQLVNQVVFGTLPAGAIDGVPFTTQPTAEVRDHANLLYAVNAGTATVSIISGPGTLGGTTTVNIVDGIARFTDLKLSGKGVYVLGVATSLPSYSPPGPFTRATITVP